VKNASCRLPEVSQENVVTVVPPIRSTPEQLPDPVASKLSLYLPYDMFGISFKLPETVVAR
jgi:hypothetical protein